MKKQYTHIPYRRALTSCVCVCVYIHTLEVVVHSIGVLWTRLPLRMQEYFYFYFKVGRGGQHVLVGFIKVFMGLPKGCGSRAPALILSNDPFLEKLVGGALAFGVALNC